MNVDHFLTISIITICRNSAATIAKTVESILDQKDAGVEYVIIDGLSTDGTQDIVRSYPLIDRFISEPDQGIADAFNKGIQLTTGEIVGLINSDDQLCPSVISLVRRFFSENPEVDAIHGDVLLYKGSCFIKRVRPAGRWWYPWRLVLFNHPTTFVRRRVYEKHGLFNTNYRIAMDVEMFLRWQSLGVRITYLPKVFAHVMCGGLSGQCATEGFREARNALLRYQYSSFLVNLQLVGKLLVNRIISLGKR